MSLLGWKVQKRFSFSRALSNAIATLLILLLVILILVPFLIYYINFINTSAAISLAFENYNYLKELQISQVESGEPALIYTGSCVISLYNNVPFESPASLTITGILYLNGSGIWVNVTSLNYPIVISGNEAILLPSYAQGKPLVIVTSLGNLFFLEPNSTVGPLQPGINNGFGVTILAQVQSSSGKKLVTVNEISNITGTALSYTTPVLLNYTVKRFYVQAPLTTNVSNVGNLQFKNWIVIGNAVYTVSTGSSNSTIYVTMVGSSVVVIANYTLT